MTRNRHGSTSHCALLDDIWNRGRLGHLPRPVIQRLISAIGFDKVDILDITGPLSTFAAVNHIIDRDYDNMPGVYECEVLGKAVGPVRTSTGVALMAERSYRRVRGEIDTLIVPGAARKSVTKARADKQLIAAIQRLTPKSRRVASVCTGAFLMAEAGLLDGHTVVTHWGACGRLANEFPNLRVDPEPIFIRTGSVYSAAGKTAGIDLALALIEEDLGRDWALEVSRYMVVHLKRSGGQSQFSVPLQAQIKDSEALNGLPTWITNNLGAELSVAALAEQAGMSERNFTRIFRQELRTTPAKFVEAARVEAARHRIEESTLPLETLARDLGFGSGERLRRAFQRRFGVSPDYYRDRFGHSADNSRIKV
ncbi:MAG: helix-turn-helix domain-containing protein [Rhodospirillaceae bacterium]|jgi:transcriptional regulator GlxA family with amidase domain|nr:helix-turn-helix domain-containing protein [Rhodospirillaceae bacterium]